MDSSIHHHGIAVDEDGRIYVGEFYGRRVQIFDSDFTHLLTIPLEDQVRGIALDTSCNIHVTQITRGHIKVSARKENTYEHACTAAVNSMTLGKFI